MFTGIIESQAVLREKQNGRIHSRLTFEQGGKHYPLKQGESVAIDGVCVTVTSCRGKKFTVDLIPETLRSTTLGRISKSQRVNMERSLRVGDTLGGHWVTGHVDGIGVIRKMERRGENFRLQIEAPPDIIRRLVDKGSVAIDGISFTLQEIRAQFFVVGVIPHTFRVTTLKWKRVGDRVNLEVDLLAKLVQRFLSGIRTTSLKEKDLRRQGF